ncbi:MAG TPA: glycosyltransferase family 39 protein [Dictyobacter sp.]|jgi:4-amino-4-deoxy-L-arabinose transferase-like glycosyltransferase|nr:glycosyltransferase family 39 protein [Dictyobacter sp.]
MKAERRSTLIHTNGKAQTMTNDASSLSRWHMNWHRLIFGAIIVLATILDVCQLSREGYGNTYYAATVKSMLTSWHNFFFVSFDAGGFVTVDKPPLGLWLQAASAWLFGFTGISLLLPQATAGIISVALLYHLVRRIYGYYAGGIAALIAALTPIAVITNRNNTFDSVLVCLLLLATWCLFLATETGRLRWLLCSALLIGLGFNVKMLQAYLVLPAFLLTYALGSPQRWRTRIWHLLLTCGVILCVSLIWTCIVDLTPTTQRPYIGSSGNNSELALILGYNGIGRLLSSAQQFALLHMLSLPLQITPTASFAPGIGQPGFFRLFTPSIGTQISWLLPLALSGIVITTLRKPFHLPLQREQHNALLWSCWLATTTLYFSISGNFHLYYLIMMMPAIAALCSIVIAEFTTHDSNKQGDNWLLILGIIGTALIQLSFLNNESCWNNWLNLLCIMGLIGLSILLIKLPALIRKHKIPHMAEAIISLNVLLLLIAPTIWDIASIQRGNGGAWLPAATLTHPLYTGLSLKMAHEGAHEIQNTALSSELNAKQASTITHEQDHVHHSAGFKGIIFSGWGALTFAGRNWNVLDPQLIRYLQQEQGETTYLVATTTSTYASLFMLKTNQPALALGGYQGWDRILTPAQLAAKVHNNTVRFFYIPITQPLTIPYSVNNLPAMHNGDTSHASTNRANHTNDDLTQWVHTHCAAVPPVRWQTDSSTGMHNITHRGGMQLYDCQQNPAV